MIVSLDFSKLSTLAKTKLSELLQKIQEEISDLKITPEIEVWAKSAEQLRLAIIQGKNEPFDFLGLCCRAKLLLEDQLYVLATYLAYDIKEAKEIDQPTQELEAQKIFLDNFKQVLRKAAREADRIEKEKNEVASEQRQQGIPLKSAWRLQ